MEGTLKSIALSEIGNTVGPSPSERLRNSVEHFGIIQPVLLAELPNEDGEIQMVIIDGNRRVAAARAARMQQIPAVVMTDITPADVAHFTLMANGFRTSNYLTEFWAIKALERFQLSSKEILGVSGMASSSLNLRNQLSGLHRDLFVALRNGNLNQSVATASARRDAAEQQILADHLRRHGKLTTTDIRTLLPQIDDEKPSESEPLPELISAAVNAAKEQGLSREAFLQLAAQHWES